MYQLLFNNAPIYDPRISDLVIRNTSLHLAVSEPGAFEFTIDNDHPQVGALTKMTGQLELLSDGNTLYRGRIISDTLGFDLARAVVSEGALAYLNDSVVPPYNFPDGFKDDAEYKAAASNGNVVAFFLGWLLKKHNATVTPAQQIKLGEVTVADPNNYISLSSTQYGATTWETIKSKLVGGLGGYILPRYEADGTYLDYFDELPLTNTQPVEFASNLLDLTSEMTAADLFTAIIPIGADGLTIAALPDGDLTNDLVKSGVTIYSKAGVAKYGRITKAETWSDVALSTNLQSKAMARLATGVMLTNSVTLTACDLHCDDATIGSLRVGRNTLIRSGPHGFSENLPLLEMDLDIQDPTGAQLTFVSTILTQTDRSRQLLQQQQSLQRELQSTGQSLSNQQQQSASSLQQQQQQLEASLTAQQQELSASLTAQQQQSEATLNTTLSERVTQTLQTCQEIVTTALDSYVKTGDLETYKSTVSTQFAQTASQLEMTFKTITDQITDVNGDLQRKYNERVSYIRFVDGNIVLGKEGSQIVLTQKNDRLSFSQNGVEVAYFADDKLVVTEAAFNVAMQIGKFKFTPGEGGNLSFKKVVS